MRAAVLSNAGLVVEDNWPDPEPGPGEALVALKKVGICGSDVHFVLDGTSKTAYQPIVLGHEPAGVVEALGPDTDGPAVGTRVAIIPLITCQECDRCKAGRSVLCKQRMCIGADCEGAWADLVKVPIRNLIPIPDGLADELAAVATDSVATAYHAVKTQGRVREGSRVAVWGTGGLGLSAIGLSAWLGASTVIAVDLREEARQWSLDSGATHAFHPDEALKEIGALGGVDTALEFVGKSVTVEGAVRSLDDAGRAVVVGVGFEPATAGRLMTFVLRERELVGSYGAEPEEVREIVAAMGEGELTKKLPKVVGDVIPLDDVLSGVKRVQSGDTGGSRIVVDIAA
jgi:D-arabinose 1-dehydrogenase-like Zn-dependent alcohol dehydrogenase